MYMKKLVFVVGWCVLWGSTGCGDDTKTVVGSCTADCNGQLGTTDCSAIDPQQYSGGLASCGAGCAVDLSGCVSKTQTAVCSANCGGKLPTSVCAEIDPAKYNAGVAVCGANCEPDLSACRLDPVTGNGGAEFDLCEGAGQGNCGAGLTCRPVNLRGVSLGVCVKSCDPTAAQPGCGSQQSCDKVTVFNPKDGVCYDRTGARDQVCGGLTGVLCADSAAACAPTVGLTEECKLSCDGADVNRGRGSCPVGEQCLPSPFVEAQKDAEDRPIRCTNVGGVDPACDAAKQYRCIMTSAGIGQPEPQCARLGGWCGKGAPQLVRFDNATLDALTPEQQCNMPGTSRYCRPLAQGTSPVECRQLNVVDLQNNQQVPCKKENQHAVCAIDKGFSCIAFPQAEYCGLMLQGCVAVCERDDGSLRTCDSGQVCGVPPTPAAGIVTQGGTNRVPCTVDASCDQASQFRCLDLSTGRVCARYRKVCTQP